MDTVGGESAKSTSNGSKRGESREEDELKICPAREKKRKKEIAPTVQKGKRFQESDIEVRTAKRKTGARFSLSCRSKSPNQWGETLGNRKKEGRKAMAKKGSE